MWNRNKTSVYDEPITAVLTDMREYGPTAPEYPDLIQRLEELTKLRAAEKRTRRPDPNTVLAVAGNLAGVLLIVAYEQKHVFNSKGMTFVRSNQT